MPHSRSSSSSSLSVPHDPTSLGDAFVPIREQKTAGTTRADFNGLLAPPLQLKEDVKEGCGGQLWPAGMVLSKWILKSPRRMDMCRGAEIIELGAGGGLVGLAIALKLEQSPSSPRSAEPTPPPQQHHTKIHITDQAILIPLIDENIALNNLNSPSLDRPIQTSSLVLNWGEELPETLTRIQPQEPASQRLILAADCVYFEPAFPLLLSTLHDLLDGETGAICWFCYKKRRRADLRFIKDLKKEFEVREIEGEDDDGDGNDEGGEVVETKARVGKERKGWEREGIQLLEVTAKKR